MTEHGHVEQGFLRQATQQNGPVPEFILNAPQLGVGLEFLYNSYIKLSTCRPSSFAGISRIPWTAISQYCHDYKIYDEEREDFEFVIDKIEEAYLGHIEKKRKEKESAPPPPRRLPNKRR